MLRKIHCCNLIVIGLIGLLFGLSMPVLAQNANGNQPWEDVITSDGSEPNKRHETAAVVWNNQIFLIGGRGVKPVDRYDPVTNTWVSLQNTPLEMHHFQPIVWSDRIYLLGGFTCCYPNEPALTHIQVYDPVDDTWSIGAEIPADRRRGGAAALVYNDRFYMLGGNTAGHNGGAVGWFDEYDPATDTWAILPDAPLARDHFAAVLVGDQLVAAGGRQTAQPDPFLNTVMGTDIYDFTTGDWRSGADIPTVRAGVMAAGYGDEVIIIGGEVSVPFAALSTVQAYNVEIDEWRTLQSIGTPRHSGGFVVLNDAIHIVSGSVTRGGGGETTNHEKLILNPDNPPPVDTDVDGLSDIDEIDIYGTEVDNADTDDDLLEDGREIDLGTDPLNNDSDLDTLSDGDEVLQHLTNPLREDTDQDTLLDPTEIQVYLTNPRNRDTDKDGLEDNVEVAGDTNPLLADSDADGLDDGTEIMQTNTVPTMADTDQDGINDGDEVNTHASDPLIPDTDLDSLTDGDEVLVHGTSPILADTDADGVTDDVEVALGFDPLKADSDDDGISDFDEINNPGQTTDGQSTDGQTTDGETTDGQSTDGETTDGQTTDTQSRSGGGAASWLLICLMSVLIVLRRRQYLSRQS